MGTTFKKINHPYVKLTVRQQEVLHIMATTEDIEDAEIACEGIECWIGNKRISYKTVKALLGYILISGWEFGSEVGIQYLHINESGKRYLAGEQMLYRVNDPNNEGELMWTDKPLIVPWF